MKRIGNVQKLYNVSAYVNFATVPLGEATHGEFQSQCGKRMPMSVDTWRHETPGIYMQSASHTGQGRKLSTWIIDAK